MEVFRRCSYQHYPSRRPELEYQIVRDRVPWVRLVDDNIDSRVLAPFMSFKPWWVSWLTTIGMPGTNMNTAGTGMLLSSPWFRIMGDESIDLDDSLLG
jgi:hypothetical protein